MAKSGTVTVTTTGTSVRGPDQLTGRRVLLAGHPDNTEAVYVGGADGEVSGSTGFPLAPLGPPIELHLNNLNELWFDAAVSGEKACWILVD